MPPTACASRTRDRRADPSYPDLVADPGEQEQQHVGNGPEVPGRSEVSSRSVSWGHAAIRSVSVTTCQIARMEDA